MVVGTLTKTIMSTILNITNITKQWLRRKVNNMFFLNKYSASYPVDNTRQVRWRCSVTSAPVGQYQSFLTKN